MLNQIAGLVLNTPLMVTPDHAETVLAILGERVGVDATEMAKGDGGARFGSSEPKMVGRGTLMIPIVGSLTHRATGMQAMSGVLDYGAIERTIEAGMQDTDVNSILLDMSTPGGAVSGAFDLRDYIFAQRGRKPIISIARDSMASAGYLIGSATDRVLTAQTGMVGSIGVVFAHVDRSKQLDMQGVKPTFIHAGAQKVAGNSAEPLSDEAREMLQDSVNQTYEQFVAAVVEARGMSASAVKGTEARVFSGAVAVEQGLADEVATLSSAIESLSADAPRSYSSMSIEGTSTMDEEKLRAEGASSERARISAILTGDAAEGRAKLANHIAFNTTMSAEAAADMLAASPVEASAPDASSAALDAANARIAELEASAASAQGKALESFAADAAGTDESGDMSASTEADPEAARVAEVKQAMRAAQGLK